MEGTLKFIPITVNNRSGTGKKSGQPYNMAIYSGELQYEGPKGVETVLGEIIAPKDHPALTLRTEHIIKLGAVSQQGRIEFRPIQIMPVPPLKRG